MIGHIAGMIALADAQSTVRTTHPHGDISLLKNQRAYPTRTRISYERVAWLLASLRAVAIIAPPRTAAAQHSGRAPSERLIRGHVAASAPGYCSAVSSN